MESHARKTVAWFRHAAAASFARPIASLRPTHSEVIGLTDGAEASIALRGEADKPVYNWPSERKLSCVLSASLTAVR